LKFFWLIPKIGTGVSTVDTVVFLEVVDLGVVYGGVVDVVKILAVVRIVGVIVVVALQVLLSSSPSKGRGQSTSPSHTQLLGIHVMLSLHRN